MTRKSGALTHTHTHEFRGRRRPGSLADLGSAPRADERDSRSWSLPRAPHFRYRWGRQRETRQVRERPRVCCEAPGEEFPDNSRIDTLIPLAETSFKQHLRLNSTRLISWTQVKLVFENVRRARLVLRGASQTSSAGANELETCGQRAEEPTLHCHEQSHFCP